MAYTHAITAKRHVGRCLLVHIREQAHQILQAPIELWDTHGEETPGAEELAKGFMIQIAKDFVEDRIKVEDLKSERNKRLMASIGKTRRAKKRPVAAKEDKGHDAATGHDGPDAATVHHGHGAAAEGGGDDKSTGDNEQTIVLKRPAAMKEFTSKKIRTQSTFEANGQQHLTTPSSGLTTHTSTSSHMPQAASQKTRAAVGPATLPMLPPLPSDFTDDEFDSDFD